MAEYIDREAAIQAAIDYVQAALDPVDLLLKSAVKALDESIRRVPAADVAPVRHGRWDDGSCTNCGWFGDCVDTPYYRYCPDCGVKMDGGDDDG